MSTLLAFRIYCFIFHSHSSSSRRISLSARRFPAPKQRKNPQDARFAVIAEIERQASEAWGDGKAVVAHDFMRFSIPAGMSEQHYADMGTMDLEVEGVLEIEAGEMSRGRGRGRARGRGAWRGQWRGRGRGGGGGGGGDGERGGRTGKKRKFGDSASASTSNLARGA